VESFRVARVLSRSELRSVLREASIRVVDAGLYGPWVETVPAGAALSRVVRSRRFLDRLARLTGRRWVPDPKRKGTYLYFRRPGNSFKLHRDGDHCEFVVLTCLLSRPGRGGDLILYPGRHHESVAAIRRSPRRGAVRIRLKAGESLLMDGRGIAHRVSRLGRGRIRVSAARCFLPT
jgi:hypothetical protein